MKLPNAEAEGLKYHNLMMKKQGYLDVERFLEESCDIKTQYCDLYDYTAGEFIHHPGYKWSLLALNFNHTKMSMMAMAYVLGLLRYYVETNQIAQVQSQEIHWKIGAPGVISSNLSDRDAELWALRFAIGFVLTRKDFDRERTQHSLEEISFAFQIPMRVINSFYL